MPLFTIEREYLMPVYQHIVIEAETPEAACAKAIEQDSWEGSRDDADNSGPTYITALCEGAHSDPYFPGTERIEVPGRFGKTAVLAAGHPEPSEQ